MKNNSKKLIDNDLENIWHPCTQMHDFESISDITPIKSGKGVYLTDYDGNKYIDCISSWWVNSLGHCNKYISKKIAKQLGKLEHVLLAGFTHKPAVKLAKMLVDITPKGLEKVFFADNGSSGVEVALKMSYHYYKNQGQSRKYFVSLTNSYHGETIGALSVSDVGLYKEVYSDILIKSLHAKVPKDTTKKQTKIALEDMQKMFEKHKNNISSVIIEPLVQCAGDMHMYDSSYLSGLRKLCTKYDILLIADEVAVGFGRTGHFFACNSADICPDIMVLSKALTGGYMALSAVMLKQNIYDMFYHPYKNISKAFLHSHSYTGNPLACTAAIATIKYMKKHDILKKNEPKIELMKKLSKKYKKLSNVTNIRQTGMIFAFDVTGYESSKRIGVYIHKEALKQGLLIRPLGNTVYFMPIYVISTKQIKYMFETVYDIIEKLEKTAQKQIKSEKK